MNFDRAGTPPPGRARGSVSQGVGPRVHALILQYTVFKCSWHMFRFIQQTRDCEKTQVCEHHLLSCM